jgi:hypothetical protein
MGAAGGPPPACDSSGPVPHGARCTGMAARADGLTRDELRYILDPADMHGPDFPGETFRVLKEKETAKFGEYRNRRLVLEAWDAWERRGDAENVRG